MAVTKPPVSGHRQTFLRRRFAPLIAVWAIALVAAGLVYWFESSMPVFHEVVAPFYWVIAVLLAVASWRWVRTRGTRDRRGADRRLVDRRARAEDSTPSANE